MKKLWRRILLLTALLVMTMTVYAAAANVQYNAGRFEFTKQTTMSSGTFTVGSRTYFTVHIKLSNAYSNLNPYIYTINNGIDLMLQNVNTGQIYYLTDKSYYSLEYDVHMSVEAGTYKFSVKNRQNYWFVLDYRVLGDTQGGGIDVQDELELAVGESKALKITDAYGNYIHVTSTDVAANSPNPGAAIVSNINDQKQPNEVTFYGRQAGVTYINVYGMDSIGVSSRDQVKVTVIEKKKTPTLLYSTLSLSPGETMYNDVLNTDSDVTWSSNRTSVATVDPDSGKITAKASGSATITATLADDGTKLKCSVTVIGQDISFKAWISSFKPGSKQLQLIPDSGGSSATFTKLRSLKMKNASSVTIPEGKTKTITFNIKGAKVTGLDKSDVAVQAKFKVDGTTFKLRCVSNKLYGQYCLNGTSNWMYSFVGD